MPKNHLVKELHQLAECFYCNNKLNDHEWKSLFNLTQHYKQTVCSCCGRKLIIKAHFDGSGHDYWPVNSEFSKIFSKKPESKERLEEKLKKK